MIGAVDISGSASLVYIFFGSGGIIAALVALLKIKPDQDSAAVAQAQGAMETMVALQKELEATLRRANERVDYYRKRYELCLNRAEIAEQRIRELEEMLGSQGRRPVEEG